MIDNKENRVVPKVNIPVRVPEDLYSSARDLINKLGGRRKKWSFQKVLEPALRRWVASGGDSSTDASTLDVTPDSQTVSTDVKLASGIQELTSVILRAQQILEGLESIIATTSVTRAHKTVSKIPAELSAGTKSPSERPTGPRKRETKIG